MNKSRAKQCAGAQGFRASSLMVSSPSGSGLDHSSWLSQDSSHTALQGLLRKSTVDQSDPQHHPRMDPATPALSVTHPGGLQHSPNAILEALDLIDTFRIMFLPSGPRDTTREPEGKLGQLLCCLEAVSLTSRESLAQRRQESAHAIWF